jgi:hypothetical protein
LFAGWRCFLLSPFSPLPSFSFLSFLYSSLRFVFMGEGTPGRQPRGRYSGPWVNLRGPWARVKHLSFAQKLQNWSPGEAKMQKNQTKQKNKKHCSSKMKILFF